MQTDNFMLIRSAQFFHSNCHINKVEILNLLNSIKTEVSVVRKIWEECQQTVSVSLYGKNYPLLLSGLVLQFKNEPTFLKRGTVNEERVGYILLVEHRIKDKTILSVSTQHLSFDDQKLSYCKRLDFKSLRNLYSDSDPQYQFINVANMTISDYALRSASYDAVDLKTALPFSGLNRFIAKSVRQRVGQRSVEYTCATSRIRMSGSRVEIVEYLRWSLETCLELLKPQRPSDFIKSFASAIKLSSKPSKLKPDSLLIDRWAIEGFIEDGIYKKPSLLESDKLSDIETQELLLLISKPLELEVTSQGIINIKSSQHLSGKIEQLKTKYKVKFNNLADYFIKSEIDMSKSLENLIDDEQLFLITFDSGKYAYRAGCLFEDHNLKSSVNLVCSALIEKQSLKQAHVEKFSAKSPGKSVDKFQFDSLFNALEKDFCQKDSLLICDDYGTEWADYFEFRVSKNEKRLIAYHCKMLGGEGASPWQEITGQAAKNLGSIHGDANVFKGRATRTNGVWCQSKIKRIRSKHTIKQMKTFLDSFFTGPVEREVCLLVGGKCRHVNVTTELNKLAADQSVKAETTQLNWILGSFISGAKSAGIQPKIYLP